MAKLVVSLPTAALAAAVLLLFAMASEASVRTTVIIDEDVNQGWRGRGGRGEPGGCWSQAQRQGNLRRCQDYLMQEAQRGGSGWRGRGGGRRDMANPQQDPFTECCSALRQMDPQCTCMGLESALGQMMRERLGEMRGQPVQSVWPIAQSLPGQCGVTSPSRCQFQGQPGGRYYSSF